MFLSATLFSAALATAGLEPPPAPPRPPKPSAMMVSNFGGPGTDVLVLHNADGTRTTMVSHDPHAVSDAVFTWGNARPEVLRYRDEAGREVRVYGDRPVTRAEVEALVENAKRGLAKADTRRIEAQARRAEADARRQAAWARVDAARLRVAALDAAREARAFAPPDAPDMRALRRDMTALRAQMEALRQSMRSDLAP